MGLFDSQFTFLFTFCKILCVLEFFKKIDMKEISDDILHK